MTPADLDALASWHARRGSGEPAALWRTSPAGVHDLTAATLRQAADLKRRLEALTNLWRSAEGGCALTCAADVQAAIKAAEEVR